VGDRHPLEQLTPHPFGESGIGRPEPITRLVIAKVKARLASEQGFSLIELLVVLNIIGVLSAMAVPSYIGFRARAEAAAAGGNVRASVPAAEAYYQLASAGDGSYNGLSAAALRQQAAGVDQSANLKAGPSALGNGYCVEDTNGSITYSYTGGIGGTAILTPSPCPVGYTVT
jgi:prepilin-type N-terminal cleavage/methylation domain-containing protein